MYFLETSAKASDNVERLFTEIAQDLLQVIIDLFVTSKNETTNSPVHQFTNLKCCIKARDIQNLLMVYYFLFITLKNILSLAFSF